MPVNFHGLNKEILKNYNKQNKNKSLRWKIKKKSFWTYNKNKVESNLPLPKIENSIFNQKINQVDIEYFKNFFQNINLNSK